MPKVLSRMGTYTTRTVGKDIRRASRDLITKRGERREEWRRKGRRSKSWGYSFLSGVSARYVLYKSVRCIFRVVTSLF